MKIGIFTECYKPVMNGVSVSIETFKNALEDRGHEVFVFAPENKEAKAEHHVYRFPAIHIDKSKLYPILVPLIDIEKTYLPEEIISELDVIHAQHMFTAGRLARYVARKYNKPLVYTYHTMLTEYSHYMGFMSSIVRSYLINMSKRFCNTCDQVITPSTPMKKILQSYGVDVPIEVIMTGINPTNYKHARDEEVARFKGKWGIKQEDKLLLYLSRIAKEKNLDFLFKAFVKIKKEYPSCHLLLAGGGPEEEWCKARIKQLKLEDSVTMTGMLPKERANEMFGVADLFVFPSITETQGIVIAEAMAAGTPPVAVGKMGPTDLVKSGKDGYLTKLDRNDFTEKVVKLLKLEKLRKEFAKSGLARVEEFSTHTSTNKLINLYQKVIEKKQKATSLKMSSRTSV